MKKMLVLLSLIFINTLTYSQVNFGVGDDEFNKNLNNIDIKAKADFGLFKVELNSTHKAEPKKVEYMNTSLKMSPADIFLAFEIAKIKGISIDVVIGSYKKNKDKGWGYIAKEMGIKPGSPEFHAMKGHAKNNGNKGNKANGNQGKGNSGKNGNKGGNGKKK